MSKIIDVKGRMIIDSRGNPTVESDIYLDNGIIGRAAVPSGASTGSKEALELRDNETLYMGLGVNQAVNNINEIIAPNLIGSDLNSISSIDNKLLELDGTSNKSKLGANAILAVSLASLKALSNDSNQPLFQSLGGRKLPRPMMNVINGGVHASNALSIQEFMIVPKGNDFKDIIAKSLTVFANLKKILKDNKYPINVGDEGGFAPNLNNTIEALDLIMLAIKQAGYQTPEDFELALDVAASELYDEQTNSYTLDGKKYNSDELINYYQKLVNDYPIISIEDPFHEDDYSGFAKFTQLMQSKIMIVGDDLFVTNERLLAEGIKHQLANAILIKPNQIGTYSETVATIKLAKANNFKTIMSHRSGETEDTTISHLSVGLETDFIKTGSLSRTDRVAKYNELLRIEEQIMKRGNE